MGSEMCIRDRIDSTFEVSKDFFNDFTQEEKDKFPFDRNLNSGYESMGQVPPST